MGITGLTSLDMTTGKLVAGGYLYVSWTDEQLVWNSSDFNDLARLTISPKDIWTPELVQGGGIEVEHVLAPAWISALGRVTWLIGSSFEGACILDVRKYPFDQHECVFNIQPSAYDASEIKMNFLTNMSATALFGEHGEWEVIYSKADLALFVEPLSRVPFNAYLLSVTLKRRHLFVIVHTSIPYFLLALLNTMIFVVPIRSGERVTFSMTILLAFIFFTSNMSDDLPHNSLKLSYVSICMAALNTATTFGIIMSVIFCRIDAESITSVPDWLKRLTFKYLRYRKRQKGSSVTVVQPFETMSAVVDLNNAHSLKRKSIDIVKNAPLDDFEDIQWTHVANMLDYVLFYINLILMLAMGLCSMLLTVI